MEQSKKKSLICRLTDIFATVLSTIRHGGQDLLNVAQKPQRSINDEGLALIKEFEGLKLTAYCDIGGVWTIGYGCTHCISHGMSISVEEAERRLKIDLIRFENGISECVKVPLNDNQFSALVCFSYNVGLQAFKDSHIFRALNMNELSMINDDLLKWDHVNGTEIEGLKRRRQAEADLFSKPIHSQLG